MTGEHRHRTAGEEEKEERTTTSIPQPRPPRARPDRCLAARPAPTSFSALRESSLAAARAVPGD
jgi:hypothetical protein